MPKQPYKVTKIDWLDSKDYIKRAFSEGKLVKGLPRDAERCLDPDELNEWCMENMNSKEFDRMRLATKQKRARRNAAKNGKKRKTADLSSGAVFDLGKLKDTYKATPSQIIERLMLFQEDWLEMGYDINRSLFQDLMRGKPIEELKKQYSYLIPADK